MKYLITGFFLLISLSNAEAQNWGTLSLGIQPASSTVGIGADFTYGNETVGLFTSIIIDPRSKSGSDNLETGISAEIASALPQTSEIRSFITLNAGVKKLIKGNLWALGGPGLTFRDDFTEHSDQYWVYWGRETEFNFSAGLLYKETDGRFVMSGRMNANPLSPVISAGFSF